MNPWQMAQQIKSKLTTVAWTAGATDEVFGTRSVHVFSGMPTEEQIPSGFPWCLVSIDTGEADPDHPEFLTQNYTVLTAAEVAGDPLGEFSIIGGSVSNLGKSVGRGVAELDERVRSAVGDLTGVDGAKILLSLTSTGTPSLIGGGGRHMVLSEHSLSALCTSSLHYAAPQELARSSTTWSWKGPHCSDRFDFVQYKLGYAASAPSSPSDFDTLVYTGTTASTTHTVVGSKNYAVFAQYSSRGQSGVIEGSSDALVGSTLAS